jgi:steroid 5-alpha reductase family enzyme
MCETARQRLKAAFSLIYKEKDFMVLLMLCVVGLVIHLTFAVSIYLDALKTKRIVVLPIVWFVTVLLFGIFGVIAYFTAKQTISSNIS